MDAGDIVLITDFSSQEESRPKLALAVELLTGIAPVIIDARHFMTGGSGRANVVEGHLRLEVPSEDISATPLVVIIYEIPPTERRRFERFLLKVGQSSAVALNADPRAWRNATEKDRTVRLFRRDGIAHMETINLRRPSAALAINAFERLDQNVWSRPNIGAGGADVFHLTTYDEVRSAVSHYATASPHWMMSRDALNFRDGKRRHQFRILVLRDQVLRVCEHVQRNVDAPCNEAQGAVSEVWSVEDLPASAAHLAIAATRSLVLQFGGVDLAIENAGVIFEVNVHPVIAADGGPETVAVPFVQAHLDAMHPKSGSIG